MNYGALYHASVDNKLLANAEQVWEAVEQEVVHFSSVYQM